MGRALSLVRLFGRNGALVAPLLILLLLAFAVPVGMMLTRGVTEQELPETWPRTAAALQAWDGQGLPSDTVARTTAEEMVAARRGGTLNRVANRLNYDIVGSRTLIFSTAARLAGGTRITGLADLTAIDPRWGERETWAALRHASGATTSFYLWASLDRRVDPDGAVVGVPREQAVFVGIFLRTFKISAVVALFCILLGYPVAYLLATLKPRIANPLLILVLLPFWTSTLVRTTAWVVLLQTNGVVNGAVQWLGLSDRPLPLLYSRGGVYIAMVHVLLPFFILPLYGVMRRVPSDTARAARSLGANPLTAFVRVYLPQTMPGVIAGAVIVFTLALGYYVTPALVGGGADQMISASIAFYTNQSLNWGMAAALSILLVAPLGAVLLAGRAVSGWRPI
ncbi:ABC transporter permease [Sphingomonas alpina]|uniref:ABC transporter permease n=1 Tax=Sphingomonas alpina TaxID=653931 RepID=A0A7H0LFT1_9SPHN|nr:ABC transporter permease [Sphingomonas alpina]QNQ08534.1 ABC transporter permease [Sphingomonas alpina]